MSPESESCLPSGEHNQSPLDAGIIRNVDFHFRRLLLQRLLAKSNYNDVNFKTNLLYTNSLISLVVEARVLRNNRISGSVNFSSTVMM